jgi:WhiB family redox-sensing transcriptional regulator
MATIVDLSVGWKSEAICRGLDPSLFYSEMDDKLSLSNNNSARIVCRQCPVRLECLMTARNNNEEFGIWGGTSPMERKNANFQRTLEKVKGEIEYQRIMELEPANRRTALKKMRSKK